MTLLGAHDAHAGVERRDDRGTSRAHPGVAHGIRPPALDRARAVDRARLVAPAERATAPVTMGTVTGVGCDAGAVVPSSLASFAPQHSTVPAVMIAQA